MELKEGYKQTEVGVMPEDWDATPLPQIIWYQEGPGLRKWQFISHGLKVINVTNLQENGYLDLSLTNRHISWEEFERTYRHFLADEGDVVMASSGNSYCKTSVIRERDLPLLMNTSVIRFKPKEATTRRFMLIYLKSDYFKDQIDLMITGGAQPNFGPAHLSKVIIPLPPTKAEQEAIADALSDADALIESLEQLIAKKRRIKQGAMQELLTGKKRLPGFSGEWEVKTLADLCSLKSGEGITADDIDQHSAYRCFGGNGLRGFTDRYTHHGCFALIGRQGALCGNVVGVEGRFFASEHALVVTATPTTDVRWLTFVLREMDLNQYSESSAQPGLSAAKLLVLEVPTSPTKDEQTAIAGILSDMDAEIAALDIKLTKARQVKQGMMQELLTGNIRLI